MDPHDIHSNLNELTNWKWFSSFFFRFSANLNWTQNKILRVKRRFENDALFVCARFTARNFRKGEWTERQRRGGRKEERRERVGVKFSLNEKKCDTRGAKVNQAEKPHCPSDGCSTLLTVWRSLTWKRVTSEQFEFSHRKRNKKYQSRHRYLWFSIRVLFACCACLERWCAILSV